jgi:hypothetical protein
VVGSPGLCSFFLATSDNCVDWRTLVAAGWRIGYDTNLHCPLSDTLFGLLFLAVLCLPKTVPT